MYVDDIKLFAKNEKDFETLIQTLRIYILDKGMEFGIEKCSMRIRKKLEKIRKGIELPNKERIRTLGEKEYCKYLGILEADTFKQVEMKENFLKRQTRRLLETKVIKGINTLAVPLVRYWGPFLKWTILELR